MTSGAAKGPISVRTSKRSSFTSSSSSSVLDSVGVAYAMMASPVSCNNQRKGSDQDYIKRDRTKIEMKYL